MAEVFRLGPGDEAVARELFALLAAVFAEQGDAEPLTESDAASLLKRKEFWALVALEGDRVVGGVTAHALPMTRARATELFIYDLAVRPDRQRQGLGRALITELLSLARAAGIETAFVPADDEDRHALDFYRAVGGAAAPVTFFTFSARAR